MRRSRKPGISMVAELRGPEPRARGWEHDRKGGTEQMREPLYADGAGSGRVQFVGKVDGGLHGALEKEEDVNPTF